ncbi:MAG: translation elongation factor Ts [Patescibacteria group bacterium]
MPISPQDVKKLRLETGAGVMDCQKALTEAKGKYAKALEIVKAKGMARAEKKQTRETKIGYIVDYLHANNQVASAVEVLCETDFVARNSEFQTMAKDIAMQVVAMNPKDVPELLAQEFIKDPSLTVAELVKTISGKVGEKLVVNRFTRLKVGESTK